MTTGASIEHALVQANLSRWFGAALRGSGCRPYGPDAGVRAAHASIRYPDLTIDGGRDPGSERRAQEKVLSAPRLIIEVLSPGTRAIDEGSKLTEYRQMDGLEMVLLVDPVAQRVRVLERDSSSGRWSDTSPADPADIPLAPFGLILPHAEIFARD